MNDARLSTLQKRIILEDLKKGKPLPLSSPLLKTSPVTRIRTSFSTKRPKKRKKETIIHYGLYDISPYTPTKTGGELRKKIEN